VTVPLITFERSSMLSRMSTTCRQLCSAPSARLRWKERAVREPLEPLEGGAVREPLEPLEGEGRWKERAVGRRGP
jgi:hypothetical protein